MDTRSESPVSSSSSENLNEKIKKPQQGWERRQRTLHREDWLPELHSSASRKNIENNALAIARSDLVFKMICSEKLNYFDEIKEEVTANQQLFIAKYREIVDTFHEQMESEEGRKANREWIANYFISQVSKSAPRAHKTLELFVKHIKKHFNSFDDFFESIKYYLPTAAKNSDTKSRFDNVKEAFEEKFTPLCEHYQGKSEDIKAFYDAYKKILQPLKLEELGAPLKARRFKKRKKKEEVEAGYEGDYEISNSDSFSSSSSEARPQSPDSSSSGSTPEKIPVFITARAIPKTKAKKRKKSLVAVELSNESESPSETSSSSTQPIGPDSSSEEKASIEKIAMTLDDENDKLVAAFLDTKSLSSSPSPLRHLEPIGESKIKDDMEAIDALLGMNIARRASSSPSRAGLFGPPSRARSFALNPISANIRPLQSSSEPVSKVKPK